jgi:putative copper export protein
MKATDSRLTSTVALVAASVWLGGLLALGAIVAPIVFTTIPRPEAVEAMTAVFQRFDLVAVACVIVILATEAWRAMGYAGGNKQAAGQPRVGRLDIARMLAGALGAVLVLAEAVWITPTIVALHTGGAVRGLGAAGLELDRMHGLAETCGKVQVVFALALIALEVATLVPQAVSGDRAPKTPTKAEKAESRGAPHAA